MKKLILAVVLTTLTACGHSLDVPPEPQHSPTTCESCRPLEGSHAGCRWGTPGHRCECGTSCDCDYKHQIPKKKRAGARD